MMYISNYFSGNPIYDETVSKLRNKSHENATLAFDEFVEAQNEQSDTTAPDESENTFVDNGVKSTLLMGRIAEQNQSSGAVTRMDLSKGVPEGLVKTNAGGYTYTGDGRKIATQTQNGIVYSTNRDIEYKLITYYDSNSPEDEPVMYIYKKADQAPNDELLKIEVNKVDPSNASYEEMLAVVGYIYRDDPKAARDAADAVDMARDYIELDGFDVRNGAYDYTGYLHEVVRRNKDNPNPANRVLAEASENLLEYLKDYPRGSDSGHIRNNSSNAIDETDFKANQGKRMNYYSTQKWDIGVYRDNSSTESNPSVLVSVDESESGGSRKIYRVHINEVNMNDAACYEMFGAICCKTENWFDALSSFKWALDNDYGMDRVKPDGSHPAYHVEQQLHPYDRLDFQETFRIAVERLTADYDERLENVRTTLLNMINDTERK